jgi:hypothetical protein
MLSLEEEAKALIEKLRGGAQPSTASLTLSR